MFSSGTADRQRHRGFTLLELMVVLVVTAVLAALAVPSMAGFVAESRLSSATNRLVYALKGARSEAMKRGLPVVLCPSADPDAAVPVCAAGAYGTGWIVYVDTDRDGARDTGEPIVSRATAEATSIAFAPDPAIAARVRFGGSGDHVDDAGEPLASAMTLSVASATTREVSIDPNGRLSVDASSE